jgi:penicillin-binding protein 2
MERVSRIRAIILLALFCLVLVLYCGKLFRLQIIETDGKTDNTTTYTTLTTVRAARGDILDRNGNVLIGNRASYDLVFNHYVIKSYDETNEALYTLLRKCDELGVPYSDHFPVIATIGW